jgi:hypothetical protein
MAGSPSAIPPSLPEDGRDVAVEFLSSKRLSPDQEHVGVELRKLAPIGVQLQGGPDAMPGPPHTPKTTARFININLGVGKEGRAAKRQFRLPSRLPMSTRSFARRGGDHLPVTVKTRSAERRFARSGRHRLRIQDAGAAAFTPRPHPDPDVSARRLERIASVVEALTIPVVAAGTSDAEDVVRMKNHPAPAS